MKTKKIKTRIRMAGTTAKKKEKGKAKMSKYVLQLEADIKDKNKVIKALKKTIKRATDKIDALLGLWGNREVTKAIIREGILTIKQTLENPNKSGS